MEIVSYSGIENEYGEVRRNESTHKEVNTATGLCVNGRKFRI